MHTRQWLQDAKTLKIKILHHIQLLKGSVGQAMTRLLTAAETWSQAINSFLDRNKKWAKEKGQIELTSLYTRTDWQPTRKQDQKHGKTQGIKLATFGWWELKPPAHQNYKKNG